MNKGDVLKKALNHYGDSLHFQKESLGKWILNPPDPTHDYVGELEEVKKEEEIITELLKTLPIPVPLIGGPCPKCWGQIDQCRDWLGILLASYNGKPSNWCGRCGIHLIWEDEKWIWTGQRRPETAT